MEIKLVEGLGDRKERGRGCFGTVYAVRVNGVPCIAKRLHDILVGRGGQEPVGAEQRRGVIDKFRRECDLHCRLRHPNIVQFMGVHYGRDEADISLIMEYMHVDLEHCMKTYPDIPLPYKTSILRDVAYGLAYLHSIPIIHRDLNAGNVLLTESLRAKIADLGVAKLFDKQAALVRTKTLCPGAQDFMPPESLSQTPRYDEKLDVFSFGHLAIYLINQKAPYVQDSTVTKEDFNKKEMQVGKRRSSLNQMGGPRHPLFSIIVQCLRDIPDQRPSSRELARRMEERCKQQPSPHINTLEILAELKQQSAELETLNSRVKEKDQAIIAKQRENDELHTQLARAKDEEHLVKGTTTRIPPHDHTAGGNAWCSTYKDHEYVYVDDISMINQPSAVRVHFLDGANDLQTVFERIRERVIDKYELGNVEDLDSRGFAEAEHRARLPTTLTLQEVAKHVFNSLKDKQAKLWSTTTTTITDLEAVNKLLGQLEGGGAVPGPRAYISVLGRYNVGKTTLLNALLSFDVLPTSQDAETAVTVFVQHQEIEVPELCKMSNGKVLERGAENIKSYLEKVQQNVRDHVLSARSTEYLVRVPIPCFARLHRDHTITPLLVDTPSSNEVSQDELKKLAYLNLQTATAYIYVMSFTELRNQHDYTAFEHIQERDQAVFNEGRVAIAVTKMDESYRAVRKDTKKLSVPKVQEIVSREIQRALKLNRVSPDIVYPLSGDFAFQARIAAKDGGSTEMVDIVRASWTNMMRASYGHQAFSIAGAMTAQKLYGDLEESSRISSLEYKIKLMIDQLDYIWQKSIATNCFLYINQALESLNDGLERIGHQLADIQATVDQCREIKHLYDVIIKSLTNREEFVKQLEDSYAADTDTDRMIKVKFRVHLNSFMENVRTKIEAGNYTPRQLEADLDDICKIANEKLAQLCWQTTFDHCQQTLVSFLVIMAERFGRMRSTLAKVCNLASRTESLPQSPMPVPDTIEDRVRDAAPKLDQIPKQNIEVSAGQWLGYAACKLQFGLPHIQLIKEEALGPIEEDIKKIVRDQHRAFFRERKDSVVLHFFKRYCKEITNLMDVLFDEYQNCPIGLSDIAAHAYCELKEKETLKDTCLRWKFELMQWRSRMMVSYRDLLPAKEDY